MENGTTGLRISEIYGVINPQECAESVIDSGGGKGMPLESVMRQLTERQQQVLDYIKDHLRRHGVPPTRAEVAEGVGLRDASTISGHLAKLALGGWIQLLPNTRRGIRVIDEDVATGRTAGRSGRRHAHRRREPYRGAYPRSSCRAIPAKAGLLPDRTGRQHGPYGTSRRRRGRHPDNT